MSYAVKELYYTLQGEGAQTGRAAVFLRFAGCNLWSGREEDRATAICQFCDTEFVGTDGPGGGRYICDSLVAAVRRCWAAGMAGTTPPGQAAPTPAQAGTPYVVCTGGEPALQLDRPLIDALHQAGFEIGIETNGTIALPAGIDWICVSPKAGTALAQTTGDELKLVYPQADAEPARYHGLDFTHFFLQPMDGPGQAANTRAALAYCQHHPKWRLSLQTHKLLGIE